MIGLKRGEVALFPHEKAWELEAQNTIKRLKDILGDVIVDIAHVGSTAIPSIKAIIRTIDTHITSFLCVAIAFLTFTNGVGFNK